MCVLILSPHITMLTILQESDTPWATRWDHYLHIFDPRIHWFSLINSLVIVIFLCVMVSMILLRSVSRDVSTVCLYLVLVLTFRADLAV